ncbi:MAG: VanZ family protein [Armatimonadota bacterium]|nr:VanZ family protein [bacterium]
MLALSYTRKNLICRWGAVVLWMGLIFFLSSQPKLPDMFGLSKLDCGDKIQHAAAYAILACFIWRALAGCASRGRIAATIAIAAAYGLSDEAHQLYVPGRSFDLWDLGADALGAAIAAYILVLLRRKSD